MFVFFHDLAQDRYTAAYKISAENIECRRRRRTCLNQVIIHIMLTNTIVEMNRDLNVFEDGVQVTLPYSIAGILSVVRLSPKKIEAVFDDFGLKVVWNGRKVEINNPDFVMMQGSYKVNFQKASTLSVRNLKMSIAEVECAYRPKELKQFS